MHYTRTQPLRDRVQAYVVRVRAAVELCFLEIASLSLRVTALAVVVYYYYFDRNCIL